MNRKKNANEKRKENDKTQKTYEDKKRVKIQTNKIKKI